MAMRNSVRTAGGPGGHRPGGPTGPAGPAPAPSTVDAGAGRRAARPGHPRAARRRRSPCRCSTSTSTRSASGPARRSSALDNYVEAVTDTALPHAIWVSPSATRPSSPSRPCPSGWPPRWPPSNRFQGRGLVRSAVPHPVRAAGVRRRHRVADHPQPDGVANHAALGDHAACGSTGRRATGRSSSCSSGRRGRCSTCWPLAGLQCIEREVHEAAALDGAGGGRSCATSSSRYLRGVLARADHRVPAQPQQLHAAVRAVRGARARTTSRCCRC